MKIGFFDSGLGGLLILKSVVLELPDYDYEYYGDTKNLPYGDKSQEEIFELTKKGIEQLFRKNCSIVIVACNTASSESLRRLQVDWLPVAHPEKIILGVIIPTVEEVVGSDCRKILLLATTRTVSSNKYNDELQKISKPGFSIEAIATPELVPLIEMNEIGTACDHVVNLIKQKQQSGGVDGVILGCTHYSVLANDLQKEFGVQVRIFNQAEIIPKKFEKYLQEHEEVEVKLSKNKIRNIFLTEHREDYDHYMQTLLEGRLLGI